MPLRPLLQAVFESVAGAATSDATLRVHIVCDRDSDHYLLIAEGWQGYRRIYRTLAHVALTGNDLHIFEDVTIDGIAGRLQAEGVPREHIICAWTQAPVVEGAVHR